MLNTNTHTHRCVHFVWLFFHNFGLDTSDFSERNGIKEITINKKCWIVLKEWKYWKKNLATRINAFCIKKYTSKMSRMLLSLVIPPYFRYGSFDLNTTPFQILQNKAERLLDYHFQCLVQNLAINQIHILLSVFLSLLLEWSINDSPSIDTHDAWTRCVPLARRERIAQLVS